jgi:outer membrane scaffolding protein for murein synthesis (MipA/OmpV family)
MLLRKCRPPLALRATVACTMLICAAAASAQSGLDGAAPAEDRPKRVSSSPVWEAGLGLSGLRLPDYRGADKSRSYLLPLPYFVYRGPRVSFDRGGLKAELLEQAGLELDFSVNLSVPVRSDGNPARQGMPNLRPALEIGPQLAADLWTSASGRNKLQLRLPLRYAFALNSSLRDAGFIFHPRLGLDMKDFAGYPGWNAGVVIGPLFATARHHDYFYTVAPRFATATRPAYEASGGYSGSQLTLSLSKRFPKHWFGAFVRADWLGGAVFADSPLVRRNTTVAAGFAFSWIFAQSADRMVRHE